MARLTAPAGVPAAGGTRADLHQAVTSWYEANARDLPWRRPDASPWAVLVSEFMLQQTPVARVLPVYAEWVARWPTPAACAADSAGDAVREWGRLGYPRRAIRLHAAAQVCVDRHGGAVPSSIGDLLALPGVGRYTAAAVASFAFGQRHAVLDTNVRRVHARAVSGLQSPAPAATAAEWQLAEALLPADSAAAAVWGVAVMELGALVCTARAPRCGGCPISARCAWQLAGQPAYDGPRRRSQDYDGTDRQCRGRLLGAVRDADEPVTRARLDAVWPDAAQRDRAISTLLADGLLEHAAPAAYRLPTCRAVGVTDNIGTWPRATPAR